MAAATEGGAETIYPDILHLLESSGLKKTAKKFRKETGCTVVSENPLPLNAIIDAKRRYNKKSLKRAVAAGKSGPVVVPKTEKKDVVVPKAEKKESEEDRQLKKEVEAVVAELGMTPEESSSKSKKSKKSRTREEPESAASTEAPNGNSDEDDEEPKQPPMKKARHSEQSEELKEKSVKKHESTDNENIHFKRIDENKWSKKIKDDRLKDQSYFTKNGDSFAEKAASDLIKVRGKDFRREMQKKKRASWKGAGEIDMGVNSVQFSDSD